jgi:hypothetical protein
VLLRRFESSIFVFFLKMQWTYLVATLQILLAEGLAEELAPLRDRLAQILSGGKLTSLRHPLKDCTNNLTIQQGSPGARLGLKRPQAFGASTAPAPKKGAAPQPLGSEQEAALRYIL